MEASCLEERGVEDSTINSSSVIIGWEGDGEGDGGGVGEGLDGGGDGREEVLMDLGGL